MKSVIYKINYKRVIFSVFGLAVVNAFILQYTEGANNTIANMYNVLYVYISLVLVALIAVTRVSFLYNDTENRIDIISSAIFSFIRIKHNTISISDIKTVVVDKNELSGIVTENSNIFTKPLIHSDLPFKVFSEKFINYAKENDIPIKDSEQISTGKSGIQLSFVISLIVTILTLIIVVGVWNEIEYKALMFLIIPAIVYLQHKKYQIKKRRKEIN
jgi:hypothetical protein